MNTINHRAHREDHRAHREFTLCTSVQNSVTSVVKILEQPRLFAYSLLRLPTQFD